MRCFRWCPVLGALLAAACGSSSQSSASTGLPHDPARAVQQALAALSKRPFDENFTQGARLHVTGVPPAQAAKLDAKLRAVNSHETGVAKFKDVHDFQAGITSSGSGTEYVKASGGSFQVSSDGVHYQPAGAGEQQTFTSLAQASLSLLARGMTGVQDRGSRTVSGVASEEYLGVIPASAMRSQFRSLLQLPPGSSLGRATMTIDVSRAEAVPVHIAEVISLSTDLAALHQPGLSGRVITVVSSTRAFSHFGPPR